MRVRNRAPCAVVTCAWTFNHWFAPNEGFHAGERQIEIGNFGGDPSAPWGKYEYKEKESNDGKELKNASSAHMSTADEVARDAANDPSQAYPRGSEWRQWDLHVHSPASFRWEGQKFFSELRHGERSRPHRRNDLGNERRIPCGFCTHGLLDV